MLKDSGRVALFATAAGVTTVHAVRLSWSLFLEYMSSSTFGGDVADAVCNYDSLTSFFESGFNASVLVEMCAKVLGSRLVYRFTECAVSAACAFSPSPFFQGAVVFHYLYPTVQEYRFGRCWLTRLLRLIASCVIPKVFRPARINPEEDADGAYLQNPPPPMAAVSPDAIQSVKAKITSGSAGSPSALRRSAAVGAGTSVKQHNKEKLQEERMRREANEVNFYAQEEAVFDAMPDVCGATLRYYVYSYRSAPFKTILQAAFIPDFSHFLVELVQWGVIFGEERTKKTSRWRILKRFIADQASTLVQMCLSYTVRYLGSSLAMKLFSEPTGGAIFWAESMLHFIFAMQILSLGMVVRVQVWMLLDRKFPATVEDEEEDCRERADREEAAARSDAWTRMPFESGQNNRNNSNAGSSDGKQGGGGDGVTNGGIVNFYAVLEVSEKSEQGAIKKAYRQLALKNHPDRVGGSVQAQNIARERMAVLNEAYDTLMDKKKKAQYDARLRMASTPNVVERLERMSAPKLAGLTAGLISVVAMAGYAHFVATFQRVTACGCGPLTLFGGMLRE